MPDPRRKSSPTIAAQSRCRILLVEDESDLRDALADVLRAAHDVVAVESGAAALDALEAASEPFQLVLTDLVMPRLSGRELARLVRARWPEVRVLFMSGYDRDQLVDGEQAPASEAILNKPFTVDELTKRIDEVLG